MEIKKLYEGLKRVQDRGEIGNAYNGCGSITEEDNDVLDCFYEYVLEKYENLMPPWAEAFVQIYSWQFQSLHEGDCVYYENDYGESDQETILRTADYLHKNGYSELEKLYVSPIKLYIPDLIGLVGDESIENQTGFLPDVGEYSHMEIVWRFYVDLLEKHKEELLQVLQEVER